MNSRDKGIRGEREFASLLAAMTDLPWLRRNLEQPRSGGCDLLVEPPLDISLSGEQQQPQTLVATGRPPSRGGGQGAAAGGAAESLAVVNSGALPG